MRRVLAARCRDRDLVEDLTQEALVKVAGSRGRLTGPSLRAYAIVTAQHLLTSHVRSVERDRRHAPRLVDQEVSDDPEDATLRAEETAALATALDELGPEQRRLLYDHVVEEVPLGDLAEMEGTTPGALAMRLARARAELRLEYVLALRHRRLPTGRCRPVLLALSAGDRRRQHNLGAAEHLLACSTCASLSEPLVERERQLAGIVAVPAAAKAVFSVLRTHVAEHPVATAAGGVAAAGAVAVAVAVAGGSSSPTAAPAPPPVTTTAAPATTAARATTAAPAPAPTPSALRLDDGTPLGAPGPDWLALVDRTAIAEGVTVVAPVTDEGFWVQDPAGALLWVVLAAPGESAVHVEPGQVVTVTGVVRPLTGSPGEQRLQGEAAARLAEQGVFLAVPSDAVTVQAPG